MIRSRLVVSLFAVTLFATAPAFAIGGTHASDQPSSYSAGQTRVAISGPMTLLEGTAGWGPYVTFLHEIVPSFMLGGETGFQYWSDSAGSLSASLWNVPLLLTGIYRFDLPTAPTFHPFLGAGVGVGIVHGSVSWGSYGGSDTAAKFQGLVHLGAMFGSEGNVFLDMRLGLINSSFMFSPSIGFMF